MPLTIPSHAKINFFLHIPGKRPDGYHSIQTLMLPISLADTLTFESLDRSEIILECSDPTLPTDQGNLIRRAAELLQKHHAPACGAKIHVEKKVPVGAGLGGGSSNGSTTLNGLNQLWNLQLPPEQLEKLAAEFGSDTAFFVQGRPAMSEGRGEILTPFPFHLSLPILLINLGFGSSTAWAYRNLNLKSHAHATTDIPSFLEKLKSLSTLPATPLQLVNDLEKPVFQKFPILSILKQFLQLRPEVWAAMMCGSGSTMMAILKNPEQAKNLDQAVRAQFGNALWTWSGTTLPSRP